MLRARVLSFAVLPLFGLAALLLEVSPRSYLWVAPAVIVFVCSIVLSLVAQPLRSREPWHFLIAPFALTLSALVFLLFIDAVALRLVVLGIAGICVWWYLTNAATFLVRPHDYQPYALENISSYLALLTSFFLYASFFSLRVFLAWPLWIGALLSGVFTFLLSYQMAWVNKLDWRRSVPFMLGLALVFAEAFLTIQFLPTTAVVSSLFMTVLLYGLSSLTRIHLQRGLGVTVVRRYAAATVAILVLTVLTARWT